ncbi:MAG: HNH endonuclease [Bacteroidales bacterium]|nr:HNH endonuclease [Bacteroidales bacterium]
MDKEGRIQTSELIQKLREIMNPTGEDLKILSGRKDDKFSQKVRNLTAHKTFERNNLAQYEDAYIKITDNGKLHLQENQEILEYLLINDFLYTDLAENLREIEKNQNSRKIEVFDENVIIQEGRKKLVEIEVYKRSSALRTYAIEHFCIDDKVFCQCCKFNFQDFYGEETGKGFIEIHHTKPIFKYEDDDLENTLAQAINNLIPVCSNCHRMIHRNRNKPLEIQYLIENIKANGIFGGVHVPCM